jgi:hypothetical protein
LRLTAEVLLELPATDAKMEMVAMWITGRRLMKNPGRPNDRPWRAFTPCCVAQKPCLELVRAEKPLHPCALVHDQRSNEMPVARFIETKHPTAERREAEPVELEPPIARRRHAAAVLCIVKKVGITPRAMGTVPRMLSSMGIRQIADTKRVSAGKGQGDFLRSALDRADQRRASVPAAFTRAYASISRASILQANRVVEVSPLGGANGDRLADRQWLARTGTDRSDS